MSPDGHPARAVGDDEIRIKTESSAYDRLIPSENKVFRVSVTAKSSSLLLGLVLIVVALGRHRSGRCGDPPDAALKREIRMIVAEKLTKRYDNGVLALDGLDLRIAPGEIYCLLGANGAGKTTTVNLFLGFIEPTGGVARINDIEVKREPLKAKRFIGFVSENVRLYDASPESPSADAVHEATRAFRQIEAELNSPLQQMEGGERSESMQAEAVSIRSRFDALIASPAFLASMTCICGHDLSLHTHLHDLSPRCRQCFSDRFGPDFDQLMWLSDLYFPGTCGLVNKPE